MIPGSRCLLRCMSPILAPLRPLRCPPFGRYRGKPDMSRTTQVANGATAELTGGNASAITGVVRHDHHNASDPKTLFIGANGPASLHHLQHQFFSQVNQTSCSHGIKLLLVRSPVQGTEQSSTPSRTNDPARRPQQPKRVWRTIHECQSQVDNAGPCIWPDWEHVRVRKADAPFRKWRTFAKDGRASCSDGKSLRCNRLCGSFVD